MEVLGKQRFVVQRTVPTLTWGREAGGFHTRISLFNYYTLLSQDGPVPCQADIFLYREDGAEAGHARRTLAPGDQWQFELGSQVRDFQGTVAVRLVPDRLPALRHDRYVGTLFFATYWDDAGHVDYTHETDRMRFEDDDSIQYESTPIPTSPSLSLSVILQSSYFGDREEDADPDCEIVVKSREGKLLLERKETLPIRGSRVLSLESLLGGKEAAAAALGGSVHVKGRHINQPMTLIRHSSGDFNIHHF